MRSRHATTGHENSLDAFRWLALEAGPEAAELAACATRALRRPAAYPESAVRRAMEIARRETVAARALELGAAFLAAADSARRIRCDRPAAPLSRARADARAVHRVFPDASSRRLERAARLRAVSAAEFRRGALACLRTARAVEGAGGAADVAIPAVAWLAGGAREAARAWKELARSARSAELRRVAAANAASASRGPRGRARVVVPGRER